MESCFGTLKTELVHQACHPTQEAARPDLFASIEGYYNRQRLHSALGYFNPEQAERHLIRCPLNRRKVNVPRELFGGRVAIEDINHTRTKTKSPQCQFASNHDPRHWGRAAASAAAQILRSA
jgi:hypothetical protein